MDVALPRLRTVYSFQHPLVHPSDEIRIVQTSVSRVVLVIPLPKHLISPHNRCSAQSFQIYSLSSVVHSSPVRSKTFHWVCRTDLSCTSVVSSLQGAVCSMRIVSMKRRRKRTVLLLSRVLTVVADGDDHNFRSSSVGVKLISTYTLRFERANNSISVCIERHGWCKNACAAYDTGLYKFVFPFISIFCTRVS